MAYQYRGAQTGDKDPWQTRHRSVPPIQQPRTPCGTYPAALRHYRRKEALCGPCRAAKNAYQKERREKVQRKSWTHGTYSGAVQHRKQREKPCEPCREAWNVYQRDYRATKKEAAQ
ncbi:hypothetical protein [Arthrobacter sp. UYCu723]